MAVETVATPRRFTRVEYYRMAEVGILREDDRVELIKGEIFELAPVGRRHKAFVINLSQLLAILLAERALVAVRSGIVLADDTEPEPDITVLRERAVPYKQREAWAEDALLVIEVAETSLAYDRSIKQRLYAVAGISEYWVVDCAAETVEVHRDPGPEGYRDVRLVRNTATLSLQAFPEVTLTTTDIFA